jgi:hypothetical protein
MGFVRRHLTHANVMVTVLAFVVIGGGAYAASTTLVPPNGRVDGRTYRQWLVKSWQVRLAKPPNASLCQRVADVELILSAPPPQRRRETFSCSVPVGRAVYIPGWGAECSTIEKAPFHGRTPAQLKACARRFTKRAFSHNKWTIDGNAVRDLHSFVKASPVFRFHMPKHNVLRLRKRSGRAAAYGAGFLLQGLAPGPHIIHRSDRYFGVRYRTAYRIHVKG